MQSTAETLPILVVDLDGTLLRSDMLFESFWSALGRDWKSPFFALLALKSGKASLKRYLTKSALIDASHLPYDSAVIERIELWRAAGGRTALVTASDETFAVNVANHLGIFDEVYGSNGAINLKGEAKSAFLRERYQDAGFVYMADAEADLIVWKYAQKAVTVNASKRLKLKAEQLGVDIEHLATCDPALSSYVKALRPHQWLKNLLIFLPMVAGHRFDLLSFVWSITAFISFSLIASSVYVLNDLLDLSADRAHPRKRKRPFASGSIPIAHGTWMAAALSLTGIATATFLGAGFLGVMLSYFVLTTAYSLHLKRRLVVDICVLAGLYTIRIIAGSVGADIPLSMWLLAFSIFFFFSLAATKRQAELVDTQRRGMLSATGRGYLVGDLPLISIMSIASGYVSVLVMALYLNSPAVLPLYSFPEALWGICCILLYWLTRIAMVTHRGVMHDDPVVYAAKDRTSIICCCFIVACATAGALI